ncbi:prolyl-tRNA synthetase [Sphaeroforma arctica JP610]|uniref:proline--tRNA ligase n=1 Tax=Sphaeroforma arctica JP610 TaxID=667725 RepID=A0A0L0G1P3_9EUKA|nr:prolyl-tRNA synthetase [Sphaeroforma arctica JP610]KNC82741.1 prolyl-tRNA synthetase [Sphaeroforma arctica JP610]|eukprot:XP_014156643.1 prolyl-tRNA synthetase [Sphaeroforma arctica JP610]
MALRVLEKIQRVIRYELNLEGSSEIAMPMLHPASLWKKSGRWSEMGPELMRLTDRRGSDYCLGPTHEEVITSLVADEIQSFRNLPVRLYQIDRKFRDEIRPRFGLIRAREFWMKDLYSFDKTPSDAVAWYNVMLKSYSNILNHLGLRHVRALADTGAIGGSLSHELHVISEIGEDNIVHCNGCGYAANDEKAVGRLRLPERTALPDASNHSNAVGGVNNLIGKIHDVFGDSRIQIVGLRFKRYQADTTSKAIAASSPIDLQGVALLPEGRSINTIKLPKPEAPDSQAGEWEACKVDSTFTIDGLKVFLDQDAGLSEFSVPQAWDVAGGQFCLIEQGDHCLDCSGTLNVDKGIEVGHAFYLGTKYSEKFGCTYKDEYNKKSYVEMGCYGLGVSRILSAMIENNHDARGLLLPEIVAPYLCCIVPLGINKDQIAQKLLDVADVLHARLSDAVPNLDQELVVDDRTSLGAGKKLADSELVGIPIRIILGNDMLQIWSEDTDAISRKLQKGLSLEVVIGREKCSLTLEELEIKLGESMRALI